MNKKTLYHILAAAVFWFLQLPALSQQTEVSDTVKVVYEDDYSSEAADKEEAIDFINDTLQSIYRPVPQDTLAVINSDKRFYYKTYLDSLLRASNNFKPVKRNLPGGLFRWFIWMAAIGIFVYLIYKLFLGQSAVFVRNRKNINGKTNIADEEMPDDPDSLIENAMAAGNYRLAVRYLYLKTLKTLADRKYIEISSNKTNYEYVREVRKHSFANDFASLTLEYEYTWYGEYPLDEKLFAQVHSGFISFNKHIENK